MQTVFRVFVGGVGGVGERRCRVITDRELNEMIDWCRKKMSNLPFNYTGKRKEGYEEAMLQVMSYLHSKKGGAE
jgi:hypothetical protein